MSADQTAFPIGPAPRLRVLDDFGFVGEGASRARSVLAENSQEYIAKGASFVESHPYVAANEYIAARLAQGLGLPVLDFTIVELAGEPLFASAWMNERSFHPRTSQDLFGRCENRDRVYDVVVFDAWIANVDRHEGNLLVREIRPRSSDQTRCNLLLNDHSHCLVKPGQTAMGLGFALEDSPAHSTQIAYIRDAVTESARLAVALRRVGSMPDGTIDAAFSELPAAFVPSRHEARLMRDYLLERRDILTQIFQAHRAIFPRLDGGPL